MDKWLKDTLQLCNDLGYRTIPNRNGRVLPFGDGETYEPKDFKNCSDFFSIALDDVILLDYDGNHGDVMSVGELEDVLDLFEMPTLVQSNEEGDSLHWLFKLPEGVDPSTLAHSADGYWQNIDIKRGNQLMHIKEGKTLTLVRKDELDVAPAALIEALTRKVGEREDLGDFAGLLEPDISEDRIVEILGKLDPDVGAVDWLNVGHALFEWDDQRGLALWDQWSKGGDKYKDGECERRWDRMEHGGGTGVGTLFYMEKSADFETDSEALEKLITKINNSDEKAIRLDLSKEVRKLDLDSFERERVAQTIKGRIKALTGVTMPIADCRGLIAPRVLEGELTNDFPKPKWCENWVYVNANNSFINVDTGEELSSSGFDLTHGRQVPVTENGGKPRASRFVADHGFIGVCSHCEYLPFEAAKVIERRGGNVLNTFDHGSVPAADAEYTERGKWAIQKVRRHLLLLCNEVETDAELLEQWFAWQVQYTGRKLMFAPLICSIQGVGKSILEVMLRGVIGSVNVGTVSPQEVKREFNPWATGVSVNVLNELKINGTNRHEISNSLKPLISDDHIMINKKGVSQYQTRNTTNYIAFSNYDDAVPMDDTDRRWWVIKVALNHIDDLERAVGQTPDKYFSELLEAVRECGQLRKYFEDYQITDEFASMVRAPESQYKDDMIRLEDSRTTWLQDIKDIIEDGETELVTEEVLSISALMEAVNAIAFGYDNITHKELSAIIRRLGYHPSSSRILVDGVKTRFWVKKQLSLEEIKTKLDL